MTREDLKRRMCLVMEIDESDFLDDNDQTIGSFINEEDLSDVIEKLEEEFNINVDSISLDDTLSEILEGLCDYFSIVER